MNSQNKTVEETLSCPQCFQPLGSCTCVKDSHEPVRVDTQLGEAKPVLDSLRPSLVEAQNPSLVEAQNRPLVESQAEDHTQPSIDMSKSKNATAARSTFNDQLGRIIGERYKLESILGVGGMGAVYRATHMKLGKTVALKMLRVNEPNVKDLESRFEREAMTTSQLQHPRLTSVHDYGVSENSEPYLVMDYIDGVTLSSALKSGGEFSLARAISIFSQICEGLAYAHSQGILHRDLKPSNIMLGKDFQGNDAVTIVDFGISKLLWSEHAAQNTATGQIMGSPSYMSPEQCQGQPMDGRSDIYSLGCLMFEVLTGTPPFRGEHPVELIYKHMHETPEFPAQSMLPQKLADIVLKCLEKNKAKRFQSADEIIHTLKNLKLDLTQRVKPRSKFQITKPVLASVVAALVILSVGAGFSSFVKSNLSSHLQTIRGTWDSDWGPVTFENSDGKIAGFWKQGAGKTGEIREGKFNEELNQLEFSYFEPWNGIKGTAILNLSKDEHKLTGTWTQENGSGSWNLSRD